MLESYTKPPLTFNQQLQQLKDRGLLIDDDRLALSHLRTISYYRLSAYWYPFRKIEQDGTISDNFQEGVHLNNVIGLYEFDRRLRLYVMDAIERFEVYVRALFAGAIGRKYGAFGHTRATNFHPNFDHHSWLEKLDNESEGAREAFVIHYKNKYRGFPTLPICWMLTELMSLGSLSHVYKGLNNVDKRTISNEFNLSHELLRSWLHTLTYIRNICSHHGRLWNRKLAIRPRPMRTNNWDNSARVSNERIFYVLVILRFLLRNLHASYEWKTQMNDLLEPVAQNERWRKAMGMPEDWTNHPNWQ